MKLNIYNDNNEPTEIDTGDKEIEYITVEVIVGNENIHIHYIDGTMNHGRSYFTHRVIYDGGYIVKKKFIKYWIELEKNHKRWNTISFDRLDAFNEKEIKEDGVIYI